MYTTLCRFRRPDGSRCGAMTTNRRGFCDEHLPFGARMRPGTPAPSRRTYRWQQLSRKVRDEWVRAHGWVCPGWKRPAHPSRDLTVDHVIALKRGGAEYDRHNLEVLCRGCNGRKAGHRA